MSSASRGASRERQIGHRLRDLGWVVTRTPASQQPFDLIALKANQRPMLVQVKSDRRSPFDNFRPADRLALSEIAAQAGADAWLAWWPPNRPSRWYTEAEWPGSAPVPETIAVGQNAFA